MWGSSRPTRTLQLPPMDTFCPKEGHAETGQKVGNQLLPGNFLFFLDKQLSLKIKARLTTKGR